MFSVSLFTTTPEPAYPTTGTRLGYEFHGRGMEIPQSPPSSFLAGKTAGERIRPLTTTQCRGLRMGGATPPLSHTFTWHHKVFSAFVVRPSCTMEFPVCEHTNRKHTARNTAVGKVEVKVNFTPNRPRRPRAGDV